MRDPVGEPGHHLARSVLTELGLAAGPATSAPVRDPPQAEFAWDDPA
jgi:hypothetical protein